MNKRQVVEFLKQGEGINCEFKEAYDQLPKNLFETICSFLNTDGGTIFLGITDKGEISGINPTKVIQIKNDLTNLSNNPKKIDLPYLLFPQDIAIDDKIIIVIQVPLSSQLHKTGGNIFLRSEDGDYKVQGTYQLAGLLNRKLSLFSEQRTLPFFTNDDLRPELFDKARALMHAYNSQSSMA